MSETNRKKKRSGAMKRFHRMFSGMPVFFRVYYVVIAILLLAQIPFAGTQSFDSWPFGGTGDDVYEIKDSQDAEMLVTVGEDHLKGAAVYGFLNELNLNFTDEKLIMTVTDAETDALLTESEILVAHQPTSSADDNGVYFAFQEEIPRGTKVRVRLHSEGFYNRGVFFELSDEALHDNVTILDGETSDQTLCMSFKHRRDRLNLLQPLLFFLLEAVTGFLLLSLYREKGIPLMPPRPAAAQVNAGGKKRRRWKKADLVRLAAGSAAVLVCMVLLAEFADWAGVRRVSRKYDARLVCMDDYMLNTRVVIRDDTVVEQIIHTNEPNFCGIGLKVQNNADGEDSGETSFYMSAKEKERLKDVSDTVRYVDGSLILQVYDAGTDELLVENTYEVGQMAGVSSVIAPGLKDSRISTVSDSFVWFGFGKTIEKSQYGRYRIVLRGRDTGENGIRLSTSGRYNGTMKKDGESKNASLCMLTFFDVNANVRTWFLRIAAGMMISILGIGLLIRLRPCRIEVVFLVSLLCMGLLYSLVVPPYCVPDERTHVDTLYRISNDMLGIDEIPGPNRIYKRSCDVDATVRNTMSLSPYMYCELEEKIFRGAGSDTALTPAYARNALDNVTILNYLPGAVGFTLARLAGRNLLTMIMMARWFNLAAVAALMFLAVRKAPFGKGVFALIGLLPKMMNQNVSCSYDGMIAGAVLFFLAYTLHLFFERDIRVTDLLAVILSAWFLAANKGGVYIPLTAVLVLLPFVHKKNKLAWYRWACCIFGSVLLVFSFKFIVRISGILLRTSGSAVKAEGKSTLYTLSDLFRSPGTLGRLFENTLAVKGQSLFGDMFGINIAQREVNAHWLVITVFIILLLTAALIRDEDRIYFTGRQKIYIFLLTAAGAGMIAVSMLLSWTTVGSETIEGLQGRYFLPYLILPVLCIQNHAITRKNTEDRKLIWIADILLYITFCNLMAAAFSTTAVTVL